MRVLAALDFGDSSLEGLRQARTLAHAVNGTLAVVHVLPTVYDLSLLFPERSLEDASELTDEAARVRSALFEHARSKIGLELTEVFVERGSPYAEIVRRAENYGADFIVVGSHGRGGLARAILGSVAERVSRHAHCSVLVARQPPATGTVLVATDLSDPSLPALEAGATAAKRRDARLVVVSVLEWAGIASTAAGGLIGGVPVLPPVEVREEVRSTLRASLEQALLRVGATGEVRVLEGSAATEIVACADELGAELVIVGTHGRTGLARLALGSVAERVIAGAGTSVLAVRHDPRH